MPDYTKGKIYRIIPTCEYDDGDIYIGSTINLLAYRMGGHIAQYKHNAAHFISSKLLFDKYGCDKCKIELIEDYPCNNKQELLRREGEIILLTKCINKNVPGRTKSESSANWYLNNCEKVKAVALTYYHTKVTKEMKKIWNDNYRLKKKQLQSIS